jgi:hypothetical protein
MHEESHLNHGHYLLIDNLSATFRARDPRFYLTDLSNLPSAVLSEIAVTVSGDRAWASGVRKLRARTKTMALVRYSSGARRWLVDSFASASYHVMPGSARSTAAPKKTTLFIFARECHHVAGLVQEID